ncbi:MAG: anion permease [Oscillospiraceae bacterium]|nr:anion permease [Oscillospiraceae bacterium]
MAKANEKPQNKARSLLMLAIAAVIVILARVLPLPEGLSREGLTALAIMIAALVLWVSEAMNMAVTTILLCCMLPFLGVMTPRDMFKGFGGSVFFFMIGTMSITTALASTTIPNRMAGAILAWSKNNPRKLVLGFTLGTAVLSSIMSNMPTCALFASLGIAIMKANGDPKPGTTNLGRCLMIAIPAGSVIGGFMTPAGGPTNIVAINALEDIGIRVTFLDWMIVGYPIGIVCAILFALWICLFYKPEKIDESALTVAHEMVSGSGALTTREIKCLCVVGLMFITWILSTWIPVFNTTVVALMGTCLFMVPGIDVISWRDYMSNGGWDGTFLVGGVGAMADACLATGAAKWIISSTLGGAASWSPFMVCLGVSALICVLHWLCPSGPAVAGFAVAPIIMLALQSGASPVALAIITAFWSGVTFLLPTDAVPMFTYSFRYYTIMDMVKEGWVPSLVFVVIVAVAVPLISGALGYGSLDPAAASEILATLG